MSPRGIRVAGVLLTAALAGCGLLPRPTAHWQVTLDASIDHEAPLTLATYGPSSANQTVLRVSAQETAMSGPASKPQAIGAVWAPPAMARYLELDAVDPAPSDPQMFARLSPGRGWTLVGALVGQGGGAIDATIPLTADVRPQFAEECVLALAWQDPSGSWWRRRFGVGGRTLGPTWRIRSPDV